MPWDKSSVTSSSVKPHVKSRLVLVAAKALAASDVVVAAAAAAAVAAGEAAAPALLSFSTGVVGDVPEEVVPFVLIGFGAGSAGWVEGRLILIRLPF